MYSIILEIDGWQRNVAVAVLTRIVTADVSTSLPIYFGLEDKVPKPSKKSVDFISSGRTNKNGIPIYEAMI